MKENAVSVGVSNRHINLSDNDVETLFGPGHKLTYMRDLKQPGQYACEEVVDVVTEKGVLPKLRILGPTRKQTQIELAMTDAIKIKVRPPMRDSGDLKGSTGITLRGPAGELTVSEGTILAARHIHMSVIDANRFGLVNKEHVKVIVGGERGMVFENVLVRADASFVLEMHVDTDEANACLLKNGDIVEFVKY